MTAIEPRASFAYGMGLIRRLPLMLAFLLVACAYGPPRERAWIAHALRRPNTRQFVVLVRHEIIRDPTGIAGVPIGDRRKFERQWITFYAVDLDSGSLVRVGEMAAPDAVWTSLDTRFAGWHADTVYAALTGCLRGGECYGSLNHTLLLRFQPRGPIEQVDSKPAGVSVPPSMLAPAPGESVYLRLTWQRRAIQLQTTYPGPYVTRFVLDSRGELVATGS